MAEGAVEEEDEDGTNAVKPETCDEVRPVENIVSMAEEELPMDGVAGRSTTDDDGSVSLTAASKFSGDGAWKVFRTVGPSQALDPSERRPQQDVSVVAL
jgi:hypothetical protein